MNYVSGAKDPTLISAEMISSCSVPFSEQHMIVCEVFFEHMYFHMFRMKYDHVQFAELTQSILPPETVSEGLRL